MIRPSLPKSLRSLSAAIVTPPQPSATAGGTNSFTAFSLSPFSSSTVSVASDFLPTVKMRIRRDPWSSSLFDLSLHPLISQFPPTSPFHSMNRRTPERMDKANCSSAGRETDKRRAPSAFSPPPPAAVAARRPTAAGGGSGGPSPPICQVEHCRADLSEAKRYYRRHKVCEAHSKAPVVIVAGLRQRFCQQCSRFHEISEFDHSKRSCRRRLAGHNERRRKGSAESQGEGSSRCRQVDQGERIQISLSGKHFQIR